MSFLFIHFQVTKIDDFELDKWWEDHKKYFPNIFNLYMVVYSSTATSCPAERAFSLTGRTIEDRRTSLLPETVNSLVVARNMYFD